MRKPRLIWETEFWFKWGDTRHVVRIQVWDSSTVAEWANALGFLAFAALAVYVLMPML